MVSSEGGSIGHCGVQEEAHLATTSAGVFAVEHHVHVIAQPVAAWHMVGAISRSASILLITPGQYGENPSRHPRCCMFMHATSQALLPGTGWEATSGTPSAASELSGRGGGTGGGGSGQPMSRMASSGTAAKNAFIRTPLRRHTATLPTQRRATQAQRDTCRRYTSLDPMSSEA